MQIVKGKISLRQSLIILFLAVSSPGLRILPVFTSEISKQASWIAPIVAVIPAIFLVFMYQNMFKKYPDKSLDELFEIILGKFIGRVITCIYILWILLLFVLYLRYFCERFLSTILIDTPMEFMLLAMLAFLFFVTKNSIEAFARMCEFFILIFIVIFFVIFFIMLPEVKISNLYPVTSYDILPILTSSLSVLSLISYVSYIFFLGNNISYKDKIKKYGLRFMLLSMVVGIMLLVITIGTLGPEATPRFPIPYFTAIKSIEILNTIERVESIFIAIWVVNDVAILGLFAYIILALLKKVLGLSDYKTVIAPLLFFSYIGSFYIGKSVIELHDFSREIGSPFNLLLGVIVPLIIYIIGKVRKKV